MATAWNAKASDQRLDALLKVLSRPDRRVPFRPRRASWRTTAWPKATAVTIRAWNGAGDQVIALDVGNGAGGAQGQFVRRPGENAVYVSGGNVLAALGLYGGPAQPQSRHFLDLQAVQEDKTAVDSITLDDEHGGPHPGQGVRPRAGARPTARRPTRPPPRWTA